MCEEDMMANDPVPAATTEALERLAQLAEDVPDELAPLDAAAAVVGRSLLVLGADVGFVATRAPEEDTIDVRRVTQYSRQPVRLSFPADAPYPLAAALANQRPLFITSNEDLSCNHPGLVRVESDDHACATIPLVDEARVVGAMNIAFEDPHEFSDEERTLIHALARNCTDALVGATPA
jgi:GAF domain-containing protein